METNRLYSYWPSSLNSDQAFNQGCDARLAAIPLSCCPYSPSSPQGINWRRGWLDVHISWGKEAKRKGYHVKPLPRLEEAP